MACPFATPCGRTGTGATIWWSTGRSARRPRVGRGDTVEVILERDTEARTVEVPADLLAALDGDPAARAAFDRLPPSHRREYAEWVDGAKRPETRLRRIARSLEMLAAGTTPKRG